MYILVVYVSDAWSLAKTLQYLAVFAVLWWFSTLLNPACKTV